MSWNDQFVFEKLHVNSKQFLNKIFKNESEYSIFKSIIKDLHYDSEEEYLVDVLKADDLVKKDSDAYYDSSFYQRLSHFRNGHKSFLKWFTHASIKWSRFDNHFYECHYKVRKEIINVKLLNPTITLNEIERELEIEKFFAESQYSKGIASKSMTNHIESIYKRKKYEFESNEPNEPNENILENNSPQEPENTPKDIQYNDIKPFPLFDLGENGHFIERIGVILNQRRYISDFDVFYLLFNPKHPITGQIDYVYWNNTSATLAYFFVILLEKKVIASKERSEVPMCLERGFFYKEKDNQYNQVVSRTVQKEMNEITKVGAFVWACDRKSKIYREIYRIISEIVGE